MFPQVLPSPIDTAIDGIATEVSGGLGTYLPGILGIVAILIVVGLVVKLFKRYIGR